MYRIRRQTPPALCLILLGAIAPSAQGSNFAVGFYHVCYLDPDRHAWCLGYGESGQLGNGSNASSEVPVPVAGDHRFRDITVGNNHSCGITEAGAVLCWGYGGTGELGNGALSDSAVPVSLPPQEPHYSDIAAGSQGTCGITAGGAARCWGSNLSGFLGDPAFAQELSAIPHPASAPATLAQIESAEGGTCALSDSGTLWCWGDYSADSFGNPLGTHEPTEWTQGEYALATKGAGYFGCALTSSGTAECWGRVFRMGNAVLPSALDTPIRFRSLSSGLDHACGIGTDKEVYCWGTVNSLLGNLANDGTSPTAISEPGPFLEVDTSSTLTCASKRDGSLWCWGAGQNAFFSYGQTPSPLSGVTVLTDPIFENGFE